MSSGYEFTTRSDLRNAVDLWMSDEPAAITFYGDIKFSPAGNNIAKPMFMRQIGSDAKYKLVEKFSDVAYPRNVKY